MKLVSSLLLFCFVVIYNSDCLILDRVKTELSNSAQFVGCKFHNLKERLNHGGDYENCTMPEKAATEELGRKFHEFNYISYLNNNNFRSEGQD